MLNIISHQEYQNQNHNDKPLSHPLGWLKLKKKKKTKQIITSVVKDVEKLKPYCDAGRIVNGAVAVENSLAAPQKVK